MRNGPGGRRCLGGEPGTCAMNPELAMEPLGSLHGAAGHEPELMGSPSPHHGGRSAGPLRVPPPPPHQELPPAARPAMVPSMASLLDGAAEYRPELSIPLHHAMSVPCEASPPGMGMSGTYTTLTPLQPLPPISAVSDKFHHPHAHHHHHHQRLPGSAGGGFALMRDERGLPAVNSLYGPYKEVPAVGQSLSPMGNGLGPLPGSQQGLHGYGPPGHDKMLSPNFEAHAAMLARGEQHLPRGLGTPPAMLPPLNGAHHPAPPGPPPPHGPALCCRLNHPRPGVSRIAADSARAFLRRGAVAAVLPAGRGTLILSSALPCLQPNEGAEVCRRQGRQRGWGFLPSTRRCRLHKQTPCKRKEQEPNKERNNSQKKSRLVFTDLQRRTLFAIFKENKRPSKEMQITISQQLGLELTTVSNFFMNARRRSLEKWQDDLSSGGSSTAPSTCTKA
ncbi:ONEC2 protein, partial [Bombycilla garrulus]|nr:ONEC2 protein [Bombycilla garrulus]